MTADGRRRAAIGLGANLGSPRRTLRAAVEALGDLGDEVATSSLYRSAPVGGPPQPAFLNAVCLITTDLTPHRLLEALHAIEDRHGRTRGERWGPRTLDLDLLLYDDLTIDDTRLQVPHPRMLERRFVLEPLGEVWPAPPIGVPLDAALAGVAGQALETVAGPGWAAARGRGGLWVAGQAVVFGLVVGLALLDVGSLGAAGLLRWAGRGLVVAGAALMIAGLRALGGNLTAFPEPVDGGTLVEDGIYRHVRHPLYGANVLLMAGLALHQRSAWALAAALVGAWFFWSKAGHEEARLMLRYPGYATYRRRVRARLIPWVI